MSKTPAGNGDSEMREEYDFSGGERGKYVDRVREGTNVVVLDPDLAAAFRSSREVNEALRVYLQEHPRKA